jgi:two-component sensor histidine kinase
MDDRFTISGPETDLGPRATLSLLLHELATNAIKYGALLTEEGRVAVTWKRSGTGESEELFLSWKEQGGPTPVAPSRRGFGSRLISMGLIETGGAQLDYPQDGFEGVFTAPLVQVQQSRSLLWVNA